MNIGTGFIRYALKTCILYCYVLSGYCITVMLVLQELQEVIKYEQQYGGIILDPSTLEKPPSANNTAVCTNSNASMQQAPRSTQVRLRLLGLF